MFVVAMMLMAVFAAYLSLAVPGQLVNLFISAFALYLVATAWLTVRRRGAAGRIGDRLALAVAILLCAPFVFLSGELALGIAPPFTSAVALRGPVLIAIYGFTCVLLLTAIGDARVVFSGGITGRARIARHLWRMCVGLTLALGSGFTNGFTRLLPGPYHVPTAFFLPQFVPLGLAVYWLVRVRLIAWRVGSHATT